MPPFCLPLSEHRVDLSCVISMEIPEKKKSVMMSELYDVLVSSGLVAG